MVCASHRIAPSTRAVSTASMRSGTSKQCSRERSIEVGREWQGQEGNGVCRSIGLAVLLIGSEVESAHVNASAWVKVEVMHSCWAARKVVGISGISTVTKAIIRRVLWLAYARRPVFFFCECNKIPNNRFIRRPIGFFFGTVPSK